MSVGDDGAKMVRLLSDDGIVQRIAEILLSRDAGTESQIDEDDHGR